MFRGFVVGVVVTIVALAVLIVVSLRLGWVAARADVKPPALEVLGAHFALESAIGRGAPKGDGPLPASDDNLLEGVRVYAANCAVCHGGPDAKASNIARGLYTQAPELAHDGVEDDPVGETYWKVTHGIRWTGMPSFAATLTDHERWQVSLFLKHMDNLPARPKAEWERVPGMAGPPKPPPVP